MEMIQKEDIYMLLAHQGDRLISPVLHSGGKSRMLLRMGSLLQMLGPTIAPGL